MTNHPSFSYFQSPTKRFFRGRILVLGLIGFGSFFLFRLFDIMVLRGTSYRAIADGNRLQSIPVEGYRGVIKDRNGVILARNERAFFTLKEGTEKTLYPLKEKEITSTQAARMAIATPTQVIAEPVRVYTNGPAFSHLLGYTGFASFRDQRELYVLPTQRVGKAGAEKTYDELLRGTAGEKTYEMSANGHVIRLVSTKPAIDGKDIVLTIDSGLSQTAFEALKDSLGAVVVSDIPSGQLLVLTSTPSYSFSDFQKALSDPKKPLINRGLSAFPPGSTFKLVTALAALESGKVTPQTQVVDEGQLKVGEQVFGNWYFRQYGRTEGAITLQKAIARSNDIFFYKAAENTGPQKIDEMAFRLGLGRPTGIDFMEEQKGLLPDPTWKEKTTGTKWFLGDTYHMGIGQGFVLATPVQINAMTATIAREGLWCGLSLLSTTRQNCEDAEIKPDYLLTVVRGMVDACSSGGTAFPFFEINTAAAADQKVACKTGTAEYGASDEKGHKKTHGWFTMFYPIKNPKVAITVFLESTEENKFFEGSTDAAPIAKKVWEAWKKTYEQ